MKDTQPFNVIFKEITPRVNGRSVTWAEIVIRNGQDEPVCSLTLEEYLNENDDVEYFLHPTIAGEYIESEPLGDFEYDDIQNVVDLIFNTTNDFCDNPEFYNLSQRELLPCRWFLNMIDDKEERERELLGKLKNIIDNNVPINGCFHA